MLIEVRLATLSSRPAAPSMERPASDAGLATTPKIVERLPVLRRCDALPNANRSSSETCESLDIPSFNLAWISISHLKCLIYRKLTKRQHRTAADSAKACYVSQKCSELPPGRLTAANPRITPNPSLTCSPCACSSRRRRHLRKELPFLDLAAIAAHRCSSFLAEAAVLVLVLALLDRFMLKSRMELNWVVSAFTISAALLAASVLTEFSSRRWLQRH
jgi:hypothetical protein